MNAAPSIRVSIVTVCFNDLKNVQRTMESLERQSVRDGWEHVLVDGASSDGTPDWYRSAGFDFPHSVISEPDKGIFDAMNKSLDIIKGDYVVFLNAGDRYIDDDVIDRILKRLESEPIWGYARALVVDGAGRKVRPLVGMMPYSRLMHLLGAATICHQAAVMRADFLRELGTFNLQMGNVADYHMLVKAASHAPPATWAEVDVEYLFGGVSHERIFDGLRARHRARVEALSLKSPYVQLDKAWTAWQVLRVRMQKKLKPVIEPIYFRLIR